MAEAAATTAADHSRPKDQWVKRKTGASTYGYSSTLALATVHYFIKCFAGGHGFHWVVPEDALLEMWVMLAIPLCVPIYNMFLWALSKLPGQNQGED